MTQFSLDSSVSAAAPKFESPGNGGLCEPVPVEARMLKWAIEQLALCGERVTSIPSDGRPLSDSAWVIRRLMTVTGWTEEVVDRRCGSGKGTTSFLLRHRPESSTVGPNKSTINRSPETALSEAKRRKLGDSLTFQVRGGGSLRVSGYELSEEFIAAWLRELATALESDAPLPPLGYGIRSISIRKR